VSAGVVFEANDALRLGFTLSSAARAPAQTELFARGPHDGPGTYEIGDPNLKVERANSVEATVRVHEESYQVEGAVWGAKFENYIFGALTGRTCDDVGICAPGDAGELKEQVYGQVNATFYGAEGKSSIQLLKVSQGTLQAKLMADYVRARLSGGAGNVPRIPPYHVGVGMDWQSTRLDAGFWVKYTAAHTQTATAETPTGGFVSLDATLGWRPLANRQNFEIALIGRNLTDTTQRNSVALNKDAVVLQGRDVRLLFRAGF
jgi:iron complex outermembrane receptor protein